MCECIYVWLCEGGHAGETHAHIHTHTHTHTQRSQYLEVVFFGNCGALRSQLMPDAKARRRAANVGLAGTTTEFEVCACACVCLCVRVCVRV